MKYCAKFIILLLLCNSVKSIKRRDLYDRCPLVRPMRNFQIEKMMGFWHVIQYYSSTENTSEYKCMRGILEITDKKEITMNFSYSFVYDPDDEALAGNITWYVPSYQDLSHWIHSEPNLFEGIYNTYIVDTDYDNWSLLMHCAEKKKNTRYLSALIMSRVPTLGLNVKAFLREKLPQYNIDLDYMFEVNQENCDQMKTHFMEDYYENVLKNKGDEKPVKIIRLS